MDSQIDSKQNPSNEEHTPELFIEENLDEHNVKQEMIEEQEDKNEELFNQDTNEDDEFEIPAFLRKQKF